MLYQAKKPTNPTLYAPFHNLHYAKSLRKRVSGTKCLIHSFVRLFISALIAARLSLCLAS